MLRRAFFSILAVLLCWAAADAHAFWVEERAGRGVVVYGDRSKLEDYPKPDVKSCRWFDAQGNPHPLNLEWGGQGYSFALESQARMLDVSLDQGYWCKTTQGYRRGSKADHPGALRSKRIIDYTKTFLGPCPPVLLQTVVGTPLEIVPLEDPYAGKMRFRVLFLGQPLGAARVENDRHDKLGETNEQGECEVERSEQDSALVIVRHTVPSSNDPGCDLIEHTALLKLLRRSSS